MKTTVTSLKFVEAFRAAGRETQFTRAALFALFDYLESYEEDCGVEIELDPIGICCEWSEYETAVEAAESCGREFTVEFELDALEWLKRRTQVIEFEGGLVIQQF